MSRWKLPVSDLDLGPRELEAVTRVVESRWLTVGPEVRAFEQEFAAFCDVDDAVAVANCTAALHLGLVALGLRPGDEVLVPSITFVATANAVVLAGGAPVFVDSRSMSDLTLDPDHASALISERTVGIVAVHYGGFPCHMEALLELCRRHDLFLVEDVAHAPGAAWNGRRLGTIGDVGCFSFFGNKNLTTGEGGMVLARDAEVLKRVRLLRSHGMTSVSWDRYSGAAVDYDVVVPGFNYRPTEFTGALGRVQLERLEENNRRRIELLSIYWDLLREISGVHVPFLGRTDGVGHLCTVSFDSSALRDHVRNHLAVEGIQTSLHYPPVHLLHHYREAKQRRDFVQLRVAERWAATSLTLPLYPSLDEDSVRWVCSEVSNAVRDFSEVHAEEGR